MWGVYSDNRLVHIGEHPIDLQVLQELEKSHTEIFLVERRDKTGTDVFEDLFRLPFYRGQLQNSRMGFIEPGDSVYEGTTSKPYNVILTFLIQVKELAELCLDRLPEKLQRQYPMWLFALEELLVRINSEEEVIVLNNQVLPELKYWLNTFNSLQDLNNDNNSST